ncbi:sn-glycerol-3-phosphate ABC transporter ATP-binding protein UgpC [Vibrio sp. FNV 38]|nr:sn-glycerol-3-phosphate ABC transporter ATP-binding protein UgpC [Vibrio sp. FNV 38]
MTKLQLKNIQKAYGDNTVIPDINLTIDDGEFVVFVGPSGCGKSTLLRMIAGLESITEGTITLNNTILNRVHPSEREVAMVFQSYALYPHMSVRKNIGFPLKMAGESKQDIDTKVQSTAESLQLTPLLDRLPSELSGGQRQRVAIGRAIVRNPELFLFDEPLSNLDAKLRSEMRLYLKQLHQKLQSTMVYVTHDQVEAMTLADKIVVLNKGTIAQIGTPEELYNAPQNKFVASFIGSPVMNFLPADTYQALNHDGSVPENATSFGLRPGQVCVDTHNPCCTMTIEVMEPLGYARLYYGHLNGTAFIVESEEHYNVGDKLPINLSKSVKHWFDDNDQRVMDVEVCHAA